MKNLIKCQHKTGIFCRVDDKERLCHHTSSHCIKNRNYGFKFEVKEWGEVPVMDLKFKRREKGDIYEYTIKNISLNEFYLHVERENMGEIVGGGKLGDQIRRTIPILREFILPLLPIDPTYAETRLLKRRLTKKELEKELGHEVEIL